MKPINCILLIDDNATDNVFHQIIINDADICNCLNIVTGGQEGLEYIIKSAEPESTRPKPDLIYLDINMPRMNGFEFLEEYEKLDSKLKTGIHIIMLTTSLNPVDKFRALADKSVMDFQNKPLTVEMLQQTAKKYFSEK
ncbi:MAG: response regulator [Bacteroidota bacterium]